MENNRINLEIMTKAIKQGLDSTSWSKLRLMYDGYCIGVEEASQDFSDCMSISEFNYWVACNCFVTGSKIDIILRKNEFINTIMKELDSIEERYQNIHYMDKDYTEPDF